MKIDFLNFLLLTAIFEGIVCQGVSMKPSSYEKLSIQDQYVRLEISYDDQKANIPKSLKNLLHQMSISTLTLQMGFIDPSGIFKDNLLERKMAKLPPINHGISLFIQNVSQISSENFQSLAQVFSISHDYSFLVTLVEADITYVSNPNDKFCAQHLNTLVELFLPCKNMAGIGAIINEKTFFVGKSFFGVKLSWTIEEKLRFQFYLDKNAQEVKNYLKISEERRYSKRCMHLEQLITQNLPVKPDQKHLSSKIKKKMPSIIYTNSLWSQFHSNYYNPRKTLYFHLNLTQLRSQTGDQRRIKTIKSRIMFPKGFQIEKVSFECVDSCGSIIQNIQANVSFLSSFSFVIFQINLSTNRTLNSSNRAKLVLKIEYKSKLKPFQQYETIAGGGQEFSNIPLTLETTDNTTLIALSHQNRNMFDRLLEPDFSIPFKTITFIIAIFGYLWIAVWKTFFSQSKQL